jgi:hypothetical protein
VSLFVHHLCASVVCLHFYPLTRSCSAKITWYESCEGFGVYYLCVLLNDILSDSMGDKVVSTSSNETLVSKLDSSNPLYLHTSDSSILTVIGIKLKGTENYTIWSNAMRLSLNAKNKVGFIDGNCVKPTEDGVLTSQRDR